MAKRPTNNTRTSKPRGALGLQGCILSHLGLTPKDLDTPFPKLFVGVVQPIDVIIQQCGQDCYDLTPAEVYKKIGSKSIKTLRAFINCIGA